MTFSVTNVSHVLAVHKIGCHGGVPSIFSVIHTVVSMFNFKGLTRPLKICKWLLWGCQIMLNLAACIWFYRRLHHLSEDRY